MKTKNTAGVAQPLGSIDYPIIDDHRKHYVRYPVMVTDAMKDKFPILIKPGKWVPVDVLLPTGYKHLVTPHGFDTESECQKACDKHNNFHGWNKEQADQIVAKSMRLIGNKKSKN